MRHEAGELAGIGGRLTTHGRFPLFRAVGEWLGSGTGVVLRGTRTRN